MLDYDERVDVIAGIFVGGAARRMGGARKEALVTPNGETIRARWERTFSDLGLPFVLVGGPDPSALVDEGTNAGPLGGLAALLAHAGERGVVTVAGDMPFVTGPMIAKLATATPRTVIAARRDHRWEPFFARWNAAACLPVVRARIAEGKLALQGALAALGVEELMLTDDEKKNLGDWDTPEDVARAR